MLGAIRLSLALLVLANHLWLPTANKVGAHAVIAFYMISGYLMAKVLNEVYPRGLSGFCRFIGNRFLRIYPLYWGVLIGTVLGLIVFPGPFQSAYSLIRVPNSTSIWLANFTLINLIDCPAILIPPAWSLAVEFFFYLAMGAILARNRLIVLVWLLVSLAITIYLVLMGAPFGDRYSTLLASSLFFSIGAAVYFHMSLLKKFAIAPLYLTILFLLFAIWPLAVLKLGGDIHVMGYYGAAGLFIPVLVTVSARPVRGTVSRIDRRLGDLAYPLFLLHFFSAGLVGALFGDWLRPLGFPYLILCAVVTLLLSILALATIDPAINRLRDILRGQARPLPEPTLFAESDKLSKISIGRP